MEACEPMREMLNLKENDYQASLFEACDGLTGRYVAHQFPCALIDGDRMLVWVADTDLTIFTKSTFLKLCDYAENELHATTVVFMLDADHRQKSQYKQMFSVIDALRMSSSLVRDTFGLPDKEAARRITSRSMMFELAL